MAVEQLYKGIELATAVSFCFWSLILDLYVFEADRKHFFGDYFGTVSKT